MQRLSKQTLEFVFVWIWIQQELRVDVSVVPYAFVGFHSGQVVERVGAATNDVLCVFCCINSASYDKNL